MVINSLKLHGPALLGFNVVMQNHYSLKSPLPIKWIRPEKVPCYKPEKSGDLEPLKDLDLSQLAPEFKDIDELKSADENVKKLFTLEYQPYKKTVAALREEYLNKVRRHGFDDKSPEARLAKMTADIRDMQVFVEKYPHDKRTKVRLKETIDKRKRLLKFLRTWDYKCFEYVLQKLDLTYKPFPGPEVYKRVERKRSLRMLTRNYCDNIISSKLSQYREALESQQEEFLEEKIKTFRWIIEQEASLGLKPTISEADVIVVEQKLKKIREERKRENVTISE